jgi:hypothetical protein
MLRIGKRLATLTLICFFSGCVAAQRGTTQVKYEPNETSSRVVQATNDGKYALYKGTDIKPQLVTEVRRGDKLGFERNGDKVIAIAGSERYEYPAGSSYYWNYRGRD